MPYKIYYTEEAKKDIKFFTNNKKMRIKIEKLEDDIKEHPKTGIGKPEQLKYKKEEVYSRRTIGMHRMIYTIDAEKEIVTILSLHGHYGDK